MIRRARPTIGSAGVLARPTAAAGETPALPNYRAARVSWKRLGAKASGRLRMLPLALLALLALIAIGPALPAEAHANLVRSEPAANSVLPDSPPAVQLWFSEQPEPRFSEITIFTSTRGQVKTSAVQVAPEDRLSLLVTLDPQQPLAPGTYTVAWKSLSAVDGHTTAGAFAFAVGVGQTVSGPVKGVLTQVGQTTQATPGSVAVRWLSYIAMAVLLGALAFPPLVLDPALRTLRGQVGGAAPGARRREPPGGRPARRADPSASLGQAPSAGSGQAPSAALRAGSGRRLAEPSPSLVVAPSTPASPSPSPNGVAANGAVADHDKEAAGAALWLDPVRLAVTRRTLQIAMLGFWATVVMTFVAAVAQAASAANVSIVRALSVTPGSPLLTLLLNTRYGQVWLGRLLLLSLLAFATTRLRATRRLPDRRARLVWYVALAVAALVPLTTSLDSHAAALAAGATPGAPVLPVFSDWVHLVATGMWVGGLVQLAVALPAGLAAAGPGRRTTLLARVVPSFSWLAGACVAALLLTGLYQALLQVGSWGALFGTTYGRALAVKLALVAPLLLLGAFNLLFSGPRLRRSLSPKPEARSPKSEVLVRAFRLAVRGEVVLACAVLAAAGVMTSSQPAKDDWAVLSRGVTLEKTAEDLRLRLRIDPGEPGFNTFTLTVRDARSGKPVTDAEKVALIVTMVEHDMGQNELVLDSQGDGTYSVDSGLTSMVGTWNAEALVRRNGRDDVRTTFTIPLGQQAPSSPAASSQTANLAPAGAPSTPVAPADARFLKNPVPPTDDSLARGQQIYEQNCMVCHGVQGHGDGPAARAMRPPPADLTQHVTAHTEGELWWWITNGVAGTQMPAWKSVLSDQQRWDVLNYIVHAFAPATR